MSSSAAQTEPCTCASFAIFLTCRHCAPVSLASQACTCSCPSPCGPSSPCCRSTSRGETLRASWRSRYGTAVHAVGVRGGWGPGVGGGAGGRCGDMLEAQGHGCGARCRVGLAWVALLGFSVLCAISCPEGAARQPHGGRHRAHPVCLFMVNRRQGMARLHSSITPFLTCSPLPPPSATRYQLPASPTSCALCLVHRPPPTAPRP